MIGNEDEYEEMLNDLMMTIHSELVEGKRIVVMAGKDKLITLTPTKDGTVILS